MGVTEAIALSMGAAWASGINFYAAVFMLGLMGATGHMQLPAELQFLDNPLVMGAAGIMYCIEFVTDKIPGVDSGWDALHTFIRIPAGALLAAGGMAEISPAAELAGLLLGGGVTAATHATKAGGRVVINSSPEPVSNWTTSLGEDVAVFAGLWSALSYPWLFLALLLLFVIFMAWFLPRFWRGVRWAMTRLRHPFTRAGRDAYPSPFEGAAGKGGTDR